MTTINKVECRKRFQMPFMTLILGITIFFSGFNISVSQISGSYIEDDSLLVQLLPKDKTSNEKLISVQFTNVSLQEALEILANQLKVGFSYNPAIMPDINVGFGMSNVPAHKIIYKLLEGTNLEPVLPPSKDVIILRVKKDTEVEIFQETVTGSVVDAQTGEPLVGVTGIVRGTNIGTTTDVNGLFSLDLPDEAEVLVFSYIGYLNQEVPIDDQTHFDIELSSDVAALEELVVVGYGTQRRADITSSIASVNVEGVQRSVSTDATLGLRGNVAGVNISPVDGSPGASVNINIRGIATFGNTGNEPLVIVDGVEIEGLQFFEFENNLGRGGPGSTTGIENINPNDIESIEILKDASAAIYGSRAANGVILITTKRGESGAPRVNYNSYIGHQRPYSPLSVANSTQYIEILQSMYGQNLEGPGSNDLPQAARDYINNPGSFQDYNWQELVYTVVV